MSMIWFLATTVLVSATPEMQREAISCLNVISERYLRRNILILHRTDIEHDDLFENIIQSQASSGEKSILISTENAVSDLRKPRNNNDAIILTKSYLNRTSLRNSLWNAKGRVIIISDSSQYDVQRAINLIWRTNRVVNILIMKIDENLINFYTWFPYREKECADVLTISHLDSWSNGSFVKGVDLFPPKLPRNFNGCDLLACSTTSPPLVLEPKMKNEYEDGYEVKPIKEIAKIYNLSLKYIPSPKNENFWSVTTGGKFSGAVGLLVKHKVDVAFGSFINRVERTEAADPLYPFIHERLAWIGPAPKLKPNFSRIYEAFSVPSTIVITVFHHVFAVICYVIGKASPTREPDAYQGLFSCYFTSWSILVNSAVSKPRNTRLRFLIMNYVIYALHITAAYQSSLIVLLTDDETEKPYETVEEMLDDGLFAHLIFGNNMSFYNQSDHEMWNRILQPGKHRYDSDFFTVLDEVAFNRTAFMLFSKAHLAFESPEKYLDARGRWRFHALPDVFFSYTTSHYMSPGNPLADLFGDTLARFRDSGLINFWISRINDRHRVPLDKNEDEDDDDDDDTSAVRRALSVDHLQGAFLLLFGCLGLAFVVFLGELVYYHCFVNGRK